MNWMTKIVTYYQLYKLEDGFWYFFMNNPETCVGPFLNKSEALQELERNHE